MGLSLGIDVGSVAVKAVAVADGGPVGWLEQPTGADIAGQCEDMLRRLAAQHGRPERVCATGYGRSLVPGAGTCISEIMANAAGAGWLQRHWDRLGEVFGAPPRPAELPGRIRTIVDVGGQDSKVITFDGEGMIENFAMNDRCAAGTGRFLEVMARVLEVDLRRLDEMACQADGPAHISSACTVFAESEIVSLLAEGVAAEQVAAGVFESVAQQVAGLGIRCGWRTPALFDGGASNSSALRRALAAHLGEEPAVPPLGQLATALGAALLAEESAG